jgi:hypothetical protein
MSIDDVSDGKVKTSNILSVTNLWLLSIPDDIKNSNTFFANQGWWLGDWKVPSVTNFFSDLLY